MVLTYTAENNQQSTLEAEVINMVVEANKEFHQIGLRKDFNLEPPDKVQDEDQSHRLDIIYDEKPLGFEKDPLATNIKMLLKIHLRK